MADKLESKLERIYTVPLGKAYEALRTKRAQRSVKLLRAFVSRHMKSDEVIISNTVNAFLWQHSIQKPPRKVKIRAIREDGKVKVYLTDEKIEDKKEQKQEKKPEQKTEPKTEQKQEKKQDQKTEAKAGVTVEKNAKEKGQVDKK